MCFSLEDGRTWDTLDMLAGVLPVVSFGMPE